VGKAGAEDEVLDTRLPVRLALDVDAGAGGAEEVGRAGAEHGEGHRPELARHLQRGLGVVQAELPRRAVEAGVGVPDAEQVEIVRPDGAAVATEQVDLLPRIGAGEADIREEAADVEAAFVRELRRRLGGGAGAGLADAAEQIVAGRGAADRGGEAGAANFDLGLGGQRTEQQHGGEAGQT